MDVRELEQRWQAAWEKAKAFEAAPENSGDADAGARRTFFCNAPYPYLNGPLHLGHAYTYTRLDVSARYWRMNGRATLLPFAFHATGEPIVGVAKRVAAKDAKQLKVLQDSGIAGKDLATFADPHKIVSYYRALNQRLVQDLGFSVDWRRAFTTIDPAYQRFVTWQYLRLREKGYVAQGTHPVIWCPACASPTGDHDRLEGEGVSPVAYTLLKFAAGKDVLVAATVRPETAYGVTNLWVNPESGLVRARVGAETWIMSPGAAAKLAEQQKQVNVLGRLQGRDLVGTRVRNPATAQDVPVLAASFVDPGMGTGIVMSVPAHAPFDLLAVRDLERAGKLKPGTIVPAQVVETPGFGPVPAAAVCEKHKVRNQNDPALEAATRELYKKEFHTGVLANSGPYSGKRVAEAKERMAADFTKQGAADRMYDTESRVVCRSGDACIVKVLENQWFLRYSDPKWKELVRENLSRLTLLPEDIRPAFEHTVGWLQDKACARKSGLGTPLPWDPDWIVETLSDSTIYMAFYTISHVIAAKKLAPEALAPAVFDYAFLGQRKAEALKTVPESALEAMRSEFLAWYPVDLRFSAEELVYNHLTFFLFHHTALFPAEHWPRGVSVNGMVTIEGEKMSKSRGNFITVRQALDTHGADVTRAALMGSAEGLAQPNWSANSADAIRIWLHRLHAWCAEKPRARPGGRLDQWLISRMQTHVRKAREAYELGKFRTALQAALFDPANDIRWYLRRTEPADGLPYALDVMVRMISPIAPHIAEECWTLLGNEGFASLATFPAPQTDEEDPVAEHVEQIVRQTANDAGEVQKIIGKPPKRIRIYVAAPWKHAVAGELAAGANDKELIAELMQKPDIRTHGNDVIRLVDRLRKSGLPALPGHGEELAALQDAVLFFSREFGCPVEIVPGAGSQHPKALRAEPGKPGIELVV